MTFSVGRKNDLVVLGSMLRQGQKEKSKRRHVALVFIIFCIGTVQLAIDWSMMRSGEQTHTDHSGGVSSTTMRIGVLDAIIRTPLRRRDDRMIEENSTTRTTRTLSIEQIYYFNSFTNPLRRQFMEEWLRRQSIPHQRIEPISASLTRCTASSRCSDRVAVALSYLRMTSRSYGKIGSTLVLQDDTIAISDLEGLEATLSELPKSWNVVRLDCTTTGGEQLESDGRTWFQQEDDSCVRSNAILWREGSLDTLQGLLPDRSILFSTGQKKMKKLGHDLDCLLSRSPFETYCINLNISHSEPSISTTEPAAHLVEDAWMLTEWGKRISVEQIQEQVRKTPPTNDTNRSVKIDRIYYHNLPKNHHRRQSMEVWLQDQAIPYERVNATVGDKHSCVPKHNNTNRCRGIAGICKTLDGILQNKDTTGVTMVLEDDIIPLDLNLDRLEESLKMVPNDWDIIRFDCWGLHDFHFPLWVNDYVVDTSKYWSATDCDKTKSACLPKKFYGGAYSMLWRGSSKHKLRKIWSQPPYHDADGRIAGRKKKLKSYCVNIGIWDHLYIRDSWSDASMLTS
jgi:hypothetical protein